MQSGRVGRPPDVPVDEGEQAPEAQSSVLAGDRSLQNAPSNQFLQHGQRFLWSAHSNGLGECSEQGVGVTELAESLVVSGVRK